MDYDYEMLKMIEDDLEDGNFEQAQKKVPDSSQPLTDAEVIELLRVAMEWGGVAIMKQMLERLGYFEEGERTNKLFFSEEERGWVETKVEDVIKNSTLVALRENGRMRLLQFHNEYPEVCTSLPMQSGIQKSTIIHAFLDSQPDKQDLEQFVEMVDDITYQDFASFSVRISIAASDAYQKLTEIVNFTDRQRKKALNSINRARNAQEARMVLRAFEPNKDEQRELLVSTVYKYRQSEQQIALDILRLMLDKYNFSDEGLVELATTVGRNAKQYREGDKKVRAIQVILQAVDHFSGEEFGTALRMIHEADCSHDDASINDILRTLRTSCTITDYTLINIVSFIIDGPPSAEGVLFTKQIFDRNLTITDGLEERILTWSCNFCEQNNRTKLSVLRMMLERGLGPNTKEDQHIVTILENADTDKTHRQQLTMLRNYGADFGHSNVQKKLNNIDKSGKKEFCTWLKGQGFNLS